MNIHELTQTQVADAVGFADHFMAETAGTILDGADAAVQLERQVKTAEEVAEELLNDSPGISGQPAYHAVLGRHNPQRFDEALTSLPGYTVLIPSRMVAPDEPAGYYRAAVMGNDPSGAIRLHVYCAQFQAKFGLPLSIDTTLSAASQSEVVSVQAHGERRRGDEVASEHVATLAAAAVDPLIERRWRQGDHVDQQWRTQHLQASPDGRSPAPATSVTAEMNRRLNDGKSPEVTVMVTREEIRTGRKLLLWHESMRDENGRPETSARPNALVTVQALAVQALKDKGRLTVVKRLLVR